MRINIRIICCPLSHQYPAIRAPEYRVRNTIFISPADVAVFLSNPENIYPFLQCKSILLNLQKKQICAYTNILSMNWFIGSFLHFKSGNLWIFVIVSKSENFPNYVYIKSAANSICKNLCINWISTECFLLGKSKGNHYKPKIPMYSTVSFRSPCRCIFGVKIVDPTALWPFYRPVKKSLMHNLIFFIVE